MADPAINMHMKATGDNSTLLKTSSIVLENTSQILASYFMLSTLDGAEMPDGIILTTLLAKKESIEQNDQRFEQLMLDIGKYCDERLDDSSNAGK